MHRKFLGLALSVLLFGVPGRDVLAQRQESASGRNEMFAGGEFERYVRYLQLQGLAGSYPWTIRSFSPAELDRLLLGNATHPWSAHLSLEPDSSHGLHWWEIPLTTAVRYNSRIPYGSNDGPVWAGRGATFSAQAGAGARWGALSVALAPMVTYTQNAPFPLMSNGQTGVLVYADGQFPYLIDLPQRFGSSPYVKLYPGDSYVRIDGRGLAVGFSTAEQWWGPAYDYPYLLGNNAPGFRHAFVGTEAPINLWIGRLHGKMEWGELDQSSYSSVTGSGARRFMSGFIGTFQPRGVDGLELGGARFFHQPWPPDGLRLRNFLKPFEAFLKDKLGSNADTLKDNQLAELFFRWRLPHSGFEVYGEYGRDDHSADSRDLILEPDHMAAYVLGFAKVWGDSAHDRFRALRTEMINFEASPLLRDRLQGVTYLNNDVRQGHTEDGQFLGADVGLGSGSAARLTLESYYPDGRWSVFWSRRVRREAAVFVPPFPTDPRALDVEHSIGVETLRFGRYAGLLTGVTGVYEINRNFTGDVFNLNVTVGGRVPLP